MRNAKRFISENLHWNQRESAFTLMEMMLALVLFTVGSVAVMSLIHQAQQGAKDGEDVLLAAHRAQECLEALRNVAYAGLTVGSGVLTSVTGCASSVSGIRSGARSVTVSEPYTSQLKQITVTVSWTTTNGTTNVALATYRSAT